MPEMDGPGRADFFFETFPGRVGPGRFFRGGSRAGPGRAEGLRAGLVQLSGQFFGLAIHYFDNKPIDATMTLEDEIHSCEEYSLSPKEAEGEDPLVFWALKKVSHLDTKNVFLLGVE